MFNAVFPNLLRRIILTFQKCLQSKVGIRVNNGSDPQKIHLGFNIVLQEMLLKYNNHTKKVSLSKSGNFQILSTH